EAKASWLSLDEFNQARRGAVVVPGPQPPSAVRVVNKNRISRLTNTAGGAGGDLYAFTEYCFPAVDIYWRLAGTCESLVRDFLTDLQAAGYGKRKSAGYGEVASFTLEPFDGFVPVPDANGLIRSQD